MIYLLWGKDAFNIELSLERIIKSQADSRTIILKDADSNSFTNESLTDSFFDNKRTIIVYSLLEKIQKSKDDKIFLETLGKISKDTTIVFIEEIPPKGALKKYLEANAKISAFEKPQSRDVISFIKERSRDMGSEISPLAAERLSTYVGPNFWQLEEELKKLVLYKKEDKLEPNIDVTDVDELVRAGFEANIFELLDAISQKNTQKAISLLDRFLDSGENEIYILTMIERQFRNIAMAKAEGLSESMLAKKAGLHPYVAKKSILQARNFDTTEINNIFEKIIKADFLLKSGGDPKQALQFIVLN